MIIPLSNDTLFFDWDLTIIDGKEVPYKIIIRDIELKKEILTTGQELDAFCFELPWHIALYPVWLFCLIFSLFFVYKFINQLIINFKNEQTTREKEKEESKKAN